MRVQAKKAVVRAFGDRDEMPVTEVYAVVFSVYSEAELLRKATQAGSVSRSAQAYIAGNPITNKERSLLISRGIKRAVNQMVSNRQRFLEIDAKAGVARLVRT